MTMRLVLASVAVAAVLLSSTSASAGPSSVFVFGDSLSDTGNLAEIQGANFPNPPFFNDSVTNGPVAVSLLAQHFGLDERPSLFANGFTDTHNLFGPGFQFGTNYAIAGAKTLNPGQGDLAGQIGGFLSRPGGGGIAPSDALYVVYIGGNDVRSAGHSNNPTTAATIVTNAVNAEIADIQLLVSKGAQRILISNVGNVGGIPEFAQQSPASQALLATQSSKLYNQLLHMSIGTLAAADPGVTFDEFDFFNFSQNVAANAASLGITDTTDPCLKSNFTPNANCIDPVTHQIEFDKFLFWDNIHPTAEVQAAWAQGLIDAVPEPTSIALLASSLLGLGYFRRRQRQS